MVCDSPPPPSALAPGPHIGEHPPIAHSPRTRAGARQGAWVSRTGQGLRLPAAAAKESVEVDNEAAQDAYEVCLPAGRGSLGKAQRALLEDVTRDGGWAHGLVRGGVGISLVNKQW